MIFYVVFKVWIFKIILVLQIYHSIKLILQKEEGFEHQEVTMASVPAPEMVTNMCLPFFYKTFSHFLLF